MRNLLKYISRSRPGFTLIEILVAALITAVIGSGAVAAVYQIYTGNTRSVAETQAIAQAENACYWISRDAMMAQAVTTGSGSSFPLVLTWNYNQNQGGTIFQITDQVTYSISGTILQRTLYVSTVNTTSLATTTSTTTTTVAQNIDPGSSETSCSYTDGVLDFQVTVKIGTVSESRSCQVKLRVDQAS